MTWGPNGLSIVLGDEVITVDPMVAFAILFGGAALIFLVNALARRPGSHCRWRRLPEGGTASLTKWRCRKCVMEAYTADRRPPKECKRILRSGL